MHRLDKSQNPFQEVLSGKQLKNKCQPLGPESINGTDLEWVVEIPDLENVFMYAANAVGQRTPLKDNTFA